MSRCRIAVLGMLALLVSAAASAAEAIHHTAELRLWPQDGRIEARVRIEPAAGGLAFRLAPSLTLDAATLDGQALQLRQTGDLWRLDGAGGTLALTYRGRLATGLADEPPLLTPEGGFLPAGTGWLPEIDGRPATFELAVEAPLPYRAVSTGRLVREEEAGGVYRARFVGERAGEGPSLFVGPYQVAERRADDIPVRTWFYAEDEALADRYLGQAVEYLGLYRDRIGPYPYSGFDIVAGPLPVGLGFPGLAYVSRRILPLPFMQTTSFAHEIVHNWWGNAVEVAYESGNWAEGLTTYMADYALAAAEGPEAARAMRLAWLRDFNALPAERDRPLRAFVAKAHDAGQIVGYNKAAFLFHMLYRRAGEAGFAAAIQRFYADHRFRRTSWDDLRRSFEASSGQGLGGFFAQWLERPGAPRLQLAAVDRRRTDQGWEVSLTLRQDAPVYSLLVPVEIATEQGPRWQDVTLDTAERTVVLPVEARPLAVAVDPDYDLFRRLAPGEAPPILRDVTLHPDARTVLAVPDERARRVADALAARLLDRSEEPPRGSNDPASSPLLVVGLSPKVAAALVEAGLPPTPPMLAGRGTARVWTARQPDRAPLLVVEADSAAALEALLRPLPHYRRDSYLLFDGGKVIDRGVWPAGESPLARRLD